MSKMTMLEITQDILSDMSGEEVNSISDTIEAEQVANIIKSTYDALINGKDWPHTRGLVQMVASGDAAKPTHMTFNEDFKRIIKINYNKIRVGETRLKFGLVKFMNADDFLKKLNSRDSTASNIDNIVDDSGITLLIRNDVPPSYYTSFDDETVIFDSYDSVLDSTLQASKTQCMAYRLPSLTIADDTIPDLPAEAFSLLLEESKSRATLKLNQVQDIKAEQESRKQGRWLSKQGWIVNGGITYSSYGKGRNRTRTTAKETQQR